MSELARTSSVRRRMLRCAAATAALALALVVGSCGMISGPRGYTVRPEGFKVPRHWSGTIVLPDVDVPAGVLAYDRLYIARFPGASGETAVVQRYWPNGRMCRWFVGVDRLADFDGDAFGPNLDVGRYMLRDRAIVFETVGVDLGGAYFIRENGVVRPDGAIEFTHDDPTGRKRAVVHAYQPTSARTMTRDADW